MNNSAAGMLDHAKGGLVAFLTWWRDELWGLVPEPMRARLTGERAKIVVAASGPEVRVIEETPGRSRALADAASLSRDEALAEAARLKTASGARVGLRMPVQSCFRRSVELPVAARADVANILNLDLERSTPFKLADVYTAAYVDEAASAGGKIKAVQLVAKRQAIDPLLEDMRAAGLKADFVDCWDDAGRAPLPVDFLAARDGPRTGVDRYLSVPGLLLGLAALLAVVASVLALSRSESALAEVQQRATETRAKAAGVRQALDTSDAAVAELTRLQRLKLLRIPAVELIEDLSKLLPDTVWITDFKLEGDALDISGLAKSGASLLPLFERSKLFTEASLTAPVTFDQQEDKERFSVRVRIRQPGIEPAAGTGEQR